MSRDQLATREFSEEVQARMTRLSNLARSFPSLEDSPGIDPWESYKLEKWAASIEAGDAARHAVRFLLTIVLNPSPHRQPALGWFDMHLALLSWDEKHRAAFSEWVKHPFWP